MKGLIIIILLAALIVVFLFTSKGKDKDADGTSYHQQVIRALDRTEQLALDRQVDAIKSALDAYYTDHNEYPDMLDLLVPDYIVTPGQLDDPWGNRFKIAKDEEMNLVLISAGQDRTFGSQDDIKRSI
jgi:type II secretory pathway pseudopilin PulG